LKEQKNLLQPSDGEYEHPTNCKGSYHCQSSEMAGFKGISPMPIGQYSEGN